MSTTRPRHSVLNLFDPLLSSNTLDRDVSDTDSDKENFTPPIADCSMTAAFFTHSYKPSQSASLVPKRRLVDIGDVTTDDSSMHMMLTDEDELEELNDDENDTLTFFRPAVTPARPVDIPTESNTPPISALRTPLGELTLDRDLTPVARTKMYRRTALPPSSLVAPEILVSPPGVDSSITSVINAVNSSGASFAQSGPTNANGYVDLIEEDLSCGTEDIVSGDIQAPCITISPNLLTNSRSATKFETPCDSLLTETPGSTGIVLSSSPSNVALQHPHHLRPNPPKTSSHDSNRRSIDLYSSFQLQLQSDDASFDLLNDKFSFLVSGSGMDSFMTAMDGDDSFDIGAEEANMEMALEKMRLEDEANKKDELSSLKVTELVIDGPKTSLKPVVVSAINGIIETKTGGKKSLQKRISFGCNSGPNSFVLPMTSPVATKPFAVPSLLTSTRQSPRGSVFTAPSSLVPPETTSTPPAPPRDPAILPPAVPALRIVKRATRFGHGRFTESASSTEIPLIPEASAASEVAPRRAKPATYSAGSRPMRLASTASGPSRVVTVQPPPIPLPANKFSTGPKRIPIVNSQTINSSEGAVARSSKEISTSMGGPRRVPITTPVVTPSANITEPVANKLPAVAGLKAPVKYGLRNGAQSALPRPASRLPAPTTGAGKLKTTTSGSGIGSGITMLGKGVPTRRMMYGSQ
ncbi:hypothetical protein BDZ94DRAFT_1324330 [Collybia nuda]|uniref:Uncharacterized protein n=1 Tax=Collybia nuda TaxID=64659 RepID=A0A9P5Y2E0_9AGAR|nr:hypothetical protein BDZ94DRAFT_1324330 [Collybia nuda]